MEITAEPQDIVINEGVATTQTFTVAAGGGGGPFSYQWYRTSGGSTYLLSGKTAPSLDVPTWSPFESDYYVNVSDGTDTVMSRLAHLTVNALPNAPAPSITTQPASATGLTVGDAAPTLSVAATGSGTLSYQWYRNTTDDNTSGFMLSGQTGASITVPTGAEMDSYYYIVVTNTDSSFAAGKQTASIRSATAHVKVNALPSAPAPSIDMQPTPDTQLEEGADSPTLIVAASVTGGGTLSYQWYRNTTDSYAGGFMLNGQTGVSYVVPTGAAHDSYYYVVVTNTVAGQQPTSTYSATAHVKVNALPDAPAPSIDTQPTAYTELYEGDARPTLSVAASVTGGGPLSYQWYRNTTDSNAGGVMLQGQTQDTYLAPTGAAHDSYYYVVITNTVPGQHPASVRSNTAHVVVQDVTSPTVSISSGINRPTAQATFGITIIFSEPVIAFTSADITVENGSLGHFQAVNSLMYTADITATAEGLVTIEVAGGVAMDNSNNPNAAATPHVVTYDTTGPTVSLSSSVANPTNQSSFVVTLAFNEPPLDFSTTDIAVTNGTASQLQSADGSTYTAVIRPAADGPVTVGLDANVVTDAAGNANTAAPTSVSTVYDGTPPTASIASTAANQTNQSAFDVTITFSEAVTGFAVGDLSVTNGTASNLSTSDNRIYTAVITPAAEGSVVVTLPSGSAADAAGNGNVAATPFSTVYDATAPELTEVHIASDNATPTLAKAGDTVTVTFRASERLAASPAVTIAGHAVAASEADGTYTAVYPMTESDAEGAVPLQIAFSDPAGNAGVTVVQTTDASVVVFDKTPPVPVIASPIDNARLTDKQPTIEGTVEPGSTVKIAINGEASEAQADSDGKWAFKPAAALIDGAYTITVDAIDPAGNHSVVQAERSITIYTEQVTVSVSDNAVDVFINGRPSKIGKLTGGQKDGRSATTLAVDERELEKLLAEAGAGAVLTLPFTANSDILIGQLNAQMIKSLAQMNAVVELKTKQATYTLSAKQFNVDALSNKLGSSVNLRDIAILIEIAAPSAEMTKLLTRAAEQGSFTVVASPVSFTVSALYGGTSTEITTFNAYVERTIALPAGTDPDKVTTGVVIEPDGTLRHVPTRVEVVDGSYTAHISSLTNSTYAVIWHPLEFADVNGHWAKKSVDNMGSRMVINGIDNDRFSPDTEITRAEFAAIIVRGLGIGLNQNQGAFSDVQSADWYSAAVQTAYAYQLINGFEDGTFRPNDKLTREQAIAILAKAMTITNGSAATAVTEAAAEGTLRSYKDADEAAPWARRGIASSIQAGVILGRSASSLAPKANITRAEVAVIVERLLKQAGLI
ncbi:Ig-like domain-containing protein [Cohnella ginsengisoli]|uniref:Ig-like domain-containing protein n=1 Tax=Cohnella ginsengisoli TaxID=425004 RepID=A0A9X4KPV8_9BACL|nr:Ig-like domain-containing protein [Cohnella ginsengisoli]MDG0794042.1 Ig-like domain-containing protein [Cohnella ginsengisoli]